MQTNTELDLDAIEARVQYHARNITDEEQWTRTGSQLVYADIPALIAALGASRAEIARLTHINDKLQYWQDTCKRRCPCYHEF